MNYEHFYVVSLNSERDIAAHEGVLACLNRFPTAELSPSTFLLYHRGSLDEVSNTLSTILDDGEPYVILGINPPFQFKASDEIAGWIERTRKIQDMLARGNFGQQ